MDAFWRTKVNDTIKGSSSCIYLFCNKIAKVALYTPYISSVEAAGGGFHGMLGSGGGTSVVSS